MNKTKCKVIPLHIMKAYGVWGYIFIFQRAFMACRGTNLSLFFSFQVPYKMCPILKYQFMCALMSLLLSSVQNFFWKNPGNKEVLENINLITNCLNLLLKLLNCVTNQFSLSLVV
jgi:hypothetical protein